MLDHEAVSEAHAVGLPDRTFGEVVGCAVVPAAGIAPDALDIQMLTDFLHEKIAANKVPRHMVVVDQLRATRPARCSHPRSWRCWNAGPGPSTPPKISKPRSSPSPPRCFHASPRISASPPNRAPRWDGTASPTWPWSPRPKSTSTSPSRPATSSPSAVSNISSRRWRTGATGRRSEPDAEPRLTVLHDPALAAGSTGRVALGPRPARRPRRRRGAGRPAVSVIAGAR
ncbi:MAG: hypothetical protein R3D59_01540 [Paracoccaceae bacterium]